jgi:DNA-binding transcriptional MerR regulator
MEPMEEQGHGNDGIPPRTTESGPPPGPQETEPGGSASQSAGGPARVLADVWSANPMDEPVARKEYYSIGEVCDLTGLRSHVLRYWETQFDILRPTKNRAGNRVFRGKDIEVILLVKRLLYDEKYTIEGARQKLEDMRTAGEITDERQGVLDSEFLTGMKSDLKEILEILSPPAGRPK